LRNSFFFSPLTSSLQGSKLIFMSLIIIRLSSQA
jgi:hypothetical protein